jgi:hypothetical protein
MREQNARSHRIIFKHSFLGFPAIARHSFTHVGLSPAEGWGGSASQACEVRHPGSRTRIDLGQPPQCRRQAIQQEGEDGGGSRLEIRLDLGL